MKPWLENIRLTAPVREFRLVPSVARSITPALVPAPEPPPPPGPSAAELEREIKAAYERGRIEGERALGEQLIQQRKEMQDLLNGVVHPLKEAVAQVVRDTEATVTELALEIARKLVGDLPISAEMVEAVVKDAMSQVADTAEFHVRLHPSDLDLLVKAQSGLLVASTNGKTIHFNAAPDVSRGGCVVQTRFGIIDARRETKLELIRANLEGA
jgi:flagellar assembly protein FliH